MKLKTKLLTLGVVLTVLPILLAMAIIFYQNAKMLEVAVEETEVMALTDLDHIAKSVYSFCQIQQGAAEAQGITYKDAHDAAKVTAVRQAVQGIKCGQTGYVFILSSKGDYVISKGSKRDGENIWGAKDADGVSFIQELCKKAKASNGQIVEQKYPWKNAGDDEARVKIARATYYEPWDWVIGASAYVLIMLCVLFLLVTYKKAALMRQIGQEIKQEAEQLFVDCREPRQKDAIMPDKAGSPQIDQQELFKTELN